MNILTDSTAVAVVGSLKSVGYSLADLAMAWTPPAPAVVASAEAFTFGVNPGTVSDVNIATAAMKHFGMTFARFWTWGPFTAPPLAVMWNDPLKYKAAGIANVAVLNFQNSAQRANLLHIAATILRPKGYKIICGNVLMGIGWLTALAALGAMADCDFVGCHAYNSTAAAALAQYQAVTAFAAAQGKGVICTEVGLHCDPKNLPAWAAETQKLYAGLKTIGGTYLQFPLFPTGTTASPQSLLDAKGQPNQPFYSAAEAALGI